MNRSLNPKTPVEFALLAGLGATAVAVLFMAWRRDRARKKTELAGTSKIHTSVELGDDDLWYFVARENGITIYTSESYDSQQLAQAAASEWIAEATTPGAEKSRRDRSLLMEAGGAVLIGLLVGGGAYLATRNRDASQVETYSTPLPRRPRPNFEMEVPRSQEALEGIEKLLCACKEVSTSRDPTGSMAWCAATMLHPEFQWPPIEGDHPTVFATWATLHMLSARLVATGSCAEPDSRTA